MVDVDLKVKGRPLQVGLFRAFLEYSKFFHVVAATRIYENDGDPEVHQFIQVKLLDVPQGAS